MEKNKEDKIKETEIIDDKKTQKKDNKEDRIEEAEIIENNETQKGDNKEDKFEEVEIIDNKKTPNKKNNSFLIVVALFVVIIGIAFVIALNNVGLLNFNKFTRTITGKKAELNYTETNHKVKEGIYMTDVSEIVEDVMPSIVSITSKTLVKSGMFGPFSSGEQYAKGAGSGIIVSKNDDELLILTNNHVIENAEELSVQFVNEKSVDAKIKGTSERKDVAIIAVKLSDLDDETTNAIKIATLGDSSKLKVGNGIIAIGNALGYGQSVTTGVVSALERDVTMDNFSSKMIQIDAAINGGNSGGALVNGSGEVIGINSIKYSSSGLDSSTASIEGMGFAIPITDVKDLITALMNGEEDTSGGVIGIEGYVIDESKAQSYNMPTGFYIAKIAEGSGAEKAKLEIGNIITEIEGKKVEQVADITNVIYDKKKGDKVKLKISYTSGREYKEKEVEVTLG